MTSAEFWRPIPTPHEVGSTVAESQTSQGKTRDLHTYARRIYVHILRASTGLRRALPPYPMWPPRMRFLFVGPVLCLRLPSDSTSRWTPLPSG
ncbi:MAG TPA: hypothetical protein DDY30_08190 [Marinobacter adhaerens]|nr:hypothetical protein [Marinobacter adhaerens]